MVGVVQNSRAIYAAGREIYHLQCARDEFGDRAVVNKLADRFHVLGDMNDLEAMARAVHLLEGVDRLIGREFDFKSMRHQLHQGSAAARKQEPFESPGSFAFA